MFDQDRDGQATILALRPISKDEEVNSFPFIKIYAYELKFNAVSFSFLSLQITISYIDEDLPYEERQLLLADYGFTCKCPRCVEEAP